MTQIFSLTQIFSMTHIFKVAQIFIMTHTFMVAQSFSTTFIFRHFWYDREIRLDLETSEASRTESNADQASNPCPMLCFQLFETNHGPPIVFFSLMSWCHIVWHISMTPVLRTHPPYHTDPCPSETSHPKQLSWLKIWWKCCFSIVFIEMLKTENLIYFSLCSDGDFLGPQTSTCVPCHRPPGL